MLKQGVALLWWWHGKDEKADTGNIERTSREIRPHAVDHSTPSREDDECHCFCCCCCPYHCQYDKQNFLGLRVVESLGF